MNNMRNFLGCLVAGGLLASAALVGCASAPEGETAPSPPSSVVKNQSDAQLANAVLNAIRQTMGYEANDIVVTVNNGVVTLTGWANQPAQESRARMIASKVPGVVKTYSQLHLWSASD